MKKKTAGLSLFMLLPLVTFIITGCAKDSTFEGIIEEIRLQHVPDAREGVFQVKGERAGRRVILLRGEVDNIHIRDLLADSLVMAGFSIRDSIKVLPGDVPWPWALVNLSVANIRASPSHRSELVNQALMGTPVKVLKEEGSWVYIQTPDRYLGWLDKSALSGRNEDELDSWKNSERIIFLSTFAYIEDPGKNHIVSDIVAGAIVEIVGEYGGKTIVRLPDGRKGSVSAGNYYSFDLWRQEATPGPERLTERAISMKGFPYLWGGTSVKGLDCSGFTRIVFFMNGLVIPRDASLQARHGKEICVNEGWQSFEPGDLLFFRGNRDGPDDSPIVHVGIYTGNSEYIHASGMVTINSLDNSRKNYNEYRSSTLQSARRITPADYDGGLVPVVSHPWY